MSWRRWNINYPTWLVRTLAGFILFFGAFIYNIFTGERRVYSVTMSVLHQEFGNKTSLTELNWIGGTCSSLTYFVIPFTTNLMILLERPYQTGMIFAAIVSAVSYIASAFVHTPTMLFLTYSIIHVIGYSIALSIVLLIVGEYFDKSHPWHLAATTLISQPALGGLFYASVDGIIIARLGWRNMFHIVGVFMLICIGLSALFFVPKEKEEELLTSSIDDAELNNEQTKEMDSWTKRSIWVVVPWSHLKENFQVVIWCIERILHMAMFSALYFNSVHFLVVVHKLSTEFASTITIAWSVGEFLPIGIILCAKFLNPWLAEIYFISSLLCFANLAIIAFVNYNTVAMFLLVFLQGFFIAVSRLNDYATSESVMRIHGSVSYSTTMMMNGIGCFFGPLFSGLILDRYGFKPFFMFHLSLTALRPFLWILILIILYHKDSKSQRQAGKEKGIDMTALEPDETTNILSPKQ